jgi:hypothetical protein
MIEINLFIKLYPQIIEHIKQQGFYDAIIFKGFSKKEEHNLNIFIKDKYTSKNEPMPQTTRHLALDDALTDLLKCKIILTTEERMELYYFKKLNSENSVKLTDTLPTQELEHIFGKNWKFNPADDFPTFWSRPQSTSEEKKDSPGKKEVISEEEKQSLVSMVGSLLKSKTESVDLDDFFNEIKSRVKNSLCITTDISSGHKPTK